MLRSEEGRHGEEIRDARIGMRKILSSRKAIRHCNTIHNQDGRFTCSQTLDKEIAISYIVYSK